MTDKTAQMKTAAFIMYTCKILACNNKQQADLVNTQMSKKLMACTHHSFGLCEAKWGMENAVVPETVHLIHILLTMQNLYSPDWTVRMLKFIWN